MKRSATVGLAFLFCLSSAPLLALQTAAGEAVERELSEVTGPALAPEIDRALPSTEAVEDGSPDLAPQPLEVSECEQQCNLEFLACKSECPPQGQIGYNPTCVFACGAAKDECCASCPP